jgi:hypothetical protein
MKNEYKILIAALVIILIVVIGAFALGGSNGPQTTVTPTAQPTNTPTPTPTPLAPGTGGSSGGASNITPTPTIAPTATPTPTIVPSPTPTSGVELTQFGYWITYPPLKPENWSTNPPPQVNPGIPNNTVYFSPTSASQNIGYIRDESYGYYVNATIYRNGDLNSSTTVNVHVDSSNNVREDSLGPYGSWYDLYLNGNFSDLLDVPDFSVTFAPGVSSMNITIADEGLDNWETSFQAMDTSYLGYIKMTITGVDDGYTYGYNDQYALTLNSITPNTPTVQFNTANAWLYNESGCQIEQRNGNTYNISVVLTRSDTSGSYTPQVEITNTNVTYDDGLYLLDPVPFQDGQTTTKVYISYNPGDNSVQNPYGIFTIDSTSDYNAGSQNQIDLNLTLFKG